ANAAPIVNRTFMISSRSADSLSWAALDHRHAIADRIVLVTGNGQGSSAGRIAALRTRERQRRHNAHMKIPADLAFTATEYRARLSRVRKTMAARDIAALILHSPENICYLSGFHTPGYYWLQFLVVPIEGDPVLVMRSLERWSVNVFSWLDPDAT